MVSRGKSFDMLIRCSIASLNDFLEVKYKKFIYFDQPLYSHSV